jgi:hypothetical protein
MKLVALALVAILSIANAIVAAAADSTDGLSGLPVVPNSFKTADPVQSYKYCGKNAQANAYMYQGNTDDENENLIATSKTWYLKALPRATVYTGPAGHVVFVTADGAAAVILAGAVISFVRFSPGLSPAEIKGLGSAPVSRECHAG